MKSIVFITPEDTGAGFRLAGVRQYTAKSEDLPHAVAELMHEPDCGLLVIDERLLDTATEEQIREMEANWEGVVVTLPAPIADTADDDHAAGLLRKAIGYHVRLG